MDIAIPIAVISGLLQILGYVVYNYMTHKGDTEPNGASWAIWTFGSVLNVMSYAFMTQDWVKDILPICCSLACFVTFAICLYRKQFGQIEKRDWIIFAVDCGITLVWFFMSATEANLLYQASTILSFVPMWIGMKNGKNKEERLPWIIWSCAYAMFGLSVYLRLNNLTELAYPVVCLVVHAYTAYLSRHNRSS